MRDFLVAIDRGTPRLIRAANSADAWGVATRQFPDAQRVEVWPASHQPGQCDLPMLPDRCDCEPPCGN